MHNSFNVALKQMRIFFCDDLNQFRTNHAFYPRLRPVALYWLSGLVPPDYRSKHRVKEYAMHEKPCPFQADIQNASNFQPIRAPAPVPARWRRLPLAPSIGVCAVVGRSKQTR
ncbi:MAG: hypothetical protein JJT99_01270 [Rhodobacteraceae bacterium]|nr:hypothetical protein [Paracoccaceae bacterium]